MNSVFKSTKITGLIKASAAALMLLSFGDASARALVGLDYSVMTGNTVQVVFTFDDTAVAPRTFTIDEPARIALDFGETENKLEQRNMQVGIGAMQSIISAASQNRTRVVLNLSQKTNNTTNVSGIQVIVTLAGSRRPCSSNTAGRPAAATVPPARTKARTASASAADMAMIRGMISSLKPRPAAGSYTCRSPRRTCWSLSITYWYPLSSTAVMHEARIR